jgi:hypothetical protein
LGITADTQNLQLSPPEFTQEQLLNQKPGQNPQKEKKCLTKGNEDIGVLKLNTWIRQTCGTVLNLIAPCNENLANHCIAAYKQLRLFNQNVFSQVTNY